MPFNSFLLVFYWIEGKLSVIHFNRIGMDLKLLNTQQMQQPHQFCMQAVGLTAWMARVSRLW